MSLPRPGCSSRQGGWLGLLCAALVFTTGAAALAAPASESQRRVDAILQQTSDILSTFTDHYFHNGDYKQTIRLGHLIEKLDPTYMDNYSTTAWLEWSDGDTPAALEDLQRGVNRNPDVYDSYSQLGDCYFLWLKQPAMALPYYIRATSFYSAAPWPVFEAAGHAAVKAGAYSRAVVSFRTAAMKADGPMETAPSRRNLQEVVDTIHRLFGTSAVY